MTDKDKELLLKAASICGIDLFFTTSGSPQYRHEDCQYFVIWNPLEDADLANDLTKEFKLDSIRLTIENNCITAAQTRRAIVIAVSES